jgi:hypothetical protein
LGDRETTPERYSNPLGYIGKLFFHRLRHAAPPSALKIEREDPRQASHQQTRERSQLETDAAPQSGKSHGLGRNAQRERPGFGSLSPKHPLGYRVLKQPQGRQPAPHRKHLGRPPDADQGSHNQER